VGDDFRAQQRRVSIWVPNRFDLVEAISRSTPCDWGRPPVCRSELCATLRVDFTIFSVFPPLSVQRSPVSGPLDFELSQNYPNPFNPTTVVRYELPAASDVKLVVYDLLGREVAVLVNEKKAPGSYDVKFDAAGLASGVYLYRLTAGNFVQTHKMILVR
jgi:hypothetical protein